jgi:hypothetical protein
LSRRKVNPRALEVSVEDKKKRIAELYLDGWSQHQIAAEIGVTQGRVSQLVQVIKGEWKARYAEDYDFVVEMGVKRLTEVWQKAKESYLRSCSPRFSKDGKPLLDPEGRPLMSAGNPEFLARMESAAVNLLKLAGAFKPDVYLHQDNRKIEVNGQPAFDFSKLYGRPPEGVGAGDGDGEGDDPVEAKVREAERKALKAAPPPESNGHKNGKPRKRE